MAIREVSINCVECDGDGNVVAVQLALFDDEGAGSVHTVLMETIKACRMA